ncbi:MAG: xanthine dehydrogenase family protein subunit M [Caldilinea sp.]|nr:xanthine dehydrogenase family protein subunit M [Caldilineaceae bacterium]MCB9117948.1 xanthine dehydrogenase family protein subunit M [Caldilineaceae bacterium]MCB9122619.1 xanthine dehydrogenase family protein subunit M [Caldilineaceae bacterium]MCO5213961.1 xanthine dehydrogenase family protein subunit M [Caldilinea sp.]MCW5845211.1 xanthine dehydrogenase family protein subunit M [Caldilinea sp.]
MKPAPFAYFAPHNLDEALDLLAQHGYDGKVLAGGQSLIPTMNFRLAQPAALVDINRVAELAFLDEDAGGGLRIGALTRQRTLERSAAVASRAPLLHATMPYIAHVQIRNRGTLGGSLAHADPAAELPAVMVALGARFRLQSRRGARWVAAADFYIGLFTTALQEDELIAEIEIPAMPARAGWSIQEIARRHGDYAIVGVAAVVELDPAGLCRAARLIYFSVGEGPTAAPSAAAVLLGQPADDGVIAAAARAAAQQDIDPLGDIHATPAYRRHLVEVLGRRALQEAFGRAVQA